MKAKKVIIAAAILVVVGLGVRLLPVGELIGWLSGTLKGAGIPGMIAFAGVYMVAAVAMIPGSALTLLAGLVYGLAGGMMVVVPGSVLGATAAALLGRTLLRAPIARKVSGNLRWAAIDRAIEKQGMKVVLLSRLSPVLPFSLLNYAFGVSPVRMKDYIVGSAVGMFPGTLAYVYLGTLIPDVADLVAGKTPQGPKAMRYSLLAAGLVATFVLVMWLSRIARRALVEAGEEQSNTTRDPS